MSEQIREQVSAFLDGELPNSETDLLLKRLMRDAELRERFGSYALIGEACRSEKNSPLARDLCGRVNRAIDGESGLVQTSGKVTGDVRAGNVEEAPFFRLAPPRDQARTDRKIGRRRHLDRGSVRHEICRDGREVAHDPRPIGREQREDAGRAAVESQLLDDASA